MMRAIFFTLYFSLVAFLFLVAPWSTLGILIFLLLCTLMLMAGACRDK